MRQGISLVLAASLLVLGASSSVAKARRDHARAPTTVYLLGPESGFGEGCFPSGPTPCLCPERWWQDFRGTFELHRVAGHQSGFWEFAITGVNWLALRLGEEVQIHGSGVYRVGMVDGTMMQELVLNLAVGDATVATFGSGLVPGGNQTRAPAIQISIFKNNQRCATTAFDIDARATAAEDILPFEVEHGSSISTRCDPACSCQASEGNLKGTFDLVSLRPGDGASESEGEVEEYAVVRLNWALGSPGSGRFSRDARVSGTGIYRFDAASGQQQAILDLAAERWQGRYDSGWSRGVGLPLIRVQAARGGSTCEAQVLDLVAVPER